MKKILLTVASVTVWGAIVAYFVVAGRMYSREMESVRLRGVRVTVLDSARMGIITPGMVRLWLSGTLEQGMEIERINTTELQKSILKHLFVREARVYVNLRGELNVELSQRRPIARVKSADGYDFYVTDDNYVLPPQSHEAIYVPVVTGVVPLPFGRDFVGELAPLNGNEKKLPKNYLFISKLINFVRLISDDDFWNAEIEQICVVGDAEYPQIEIVPRVGDHIVVFGSPDDARKKLDKLLTFYRRALRYEGWESYRRIDVRFEGQVVCAK